jgi:hypothetical protein
VTSASRSEVSGFVGETLGPVLAERRAMTRSVPARVGPRSRRATAAVWLGGAGLVALLLALAWWRGAQPASPPVALPGGPLGPNLVTNPSFEAGLHGWTGAGARQRVIEVADAPDGRHVAEILATSGSFATLDDYPETVGASVRGRGYLASAWVRAASSADVGRQVSIKMRERGPGGDREWSSGALALTTRFQRILVVAVATASGRLIDVRISLSPALIGDSYLVDAVELRAQGDRAKQ